MPTPSEIVRDFIALWEVDEGFPAAVERFFRDDTVWENVGLLTTTGKEEAIGFFNQFGEATGMKGMRIDVHAIAETGNKVLTHRTDWILDGETMPVMEVPVMGIFEIEDGKIAAWRDYFDTLKNSPPQGDA